MKGQKYLKYNKRGCFITSCRVSTVFIGSVSYQTVKPQWAANRGRSHNCRRRKWTFSLWFSCCRGGAAGAGEQCHINTGAVSQTVFRLFSAQPASDEY